MSINAWESRQNWLIQYNYKNRQEMALLNKDRDEFFVVANPDTSQQGLYNDIDGGPSFWPSWYTDKGKRFFRLIQSIDLLDGEISRNNGIKPKNPQAALDFQKLIASLHENSNPVLMIVEMK